MRQARTIQLAWKRRRSRPGPLSSLRLIPTHTHVSAETLRPLNAIRLAPASARLGPPRGACRLLPCEREHMQPVMRPCRVLPACRRSWSELFSQSFSLPPLSLLPLSFFFFLSLSLCLSARHRKCVNIQSESTLCPTTIWNPV